MTGHTLVLRGDARALPLPDESVDLIVTSPPFYALRSYSDGGEHYPGQIGSEPTPAEYIATLVDCTAEWIRVLKPTGSIFVDLGDKYSDRGHGPNRGHGTGRGPQATALSQTRGPREKSLLLLPERYRIAAVDQLGLIARAVITWHKPNGLPESVTDRVRRSHEDWVHLTKRPRYYAAVDETREPQAELHRSTGKVENRGTRRVDGNANQGFGLNGHTPRQYHPLGKLPGSVWSIPSEPLVVPEHLGVDHFAAFPLEWPLRLIAGWSPPGICTACGEGRRPVASRTPMQWRESPTIAGRRNGSSYRPASGTMLAPAVTMITGYACACTPVTDHPERRRHAWSERLPVREYHLDGWTMPPARPAVVLDPFAGTGTTMLAAKALGRVGIGVDRSADYCRLAQWRTTDPAGLAKAMRVSPPPKQLDGQGTLFDLAEVQP